VDPQRHRRRRPVTTDHETTEETIMATEHQTAALPAPGQTKVRTISENAKTLKFDQSGFEEH
jgi:hypothetical protein